MIFFAAENRVKRRYCCPLWKKSVNCCAFSCGLRNWRIRLWGAWTCTPFWWWGFTVLISRSSSRTNEATFHFFSRPALIAQVPVQRITKYPLLLGRLLRATAQQDVETRETLREAQAKVESYLTAINSVSFACSGRRRHDQLSIWKMIWQFSLVLSLPLNPNKIECRRPRSWAVSPVLGVEGTRCPISISTLTWIPFSGPRAKIWWLCVCEK